MTEHEKKSNVFWIYILECDNGNYYTGYTKDLMKRYEQHLAGKANSKYTRSFKPKRIAQCWQLNDSIGTALKIERFIKQQSRATKELFIQFPANLETKLSRKFSLDFDLKPFDYSNKKPD